MFFKFHNFLREYWDGFEKEMIISFVFYYFGMIFCLNINHLFLDDNWLFKMLFGKYTQQNSIKKK